MSLPGAATLLSVLSSVFPAACVCLSACLPCCGSLRATCTAGAGTSAPVSALVFGGGAAAASPDAGDLLSALRSAQMNSHSLAIRWGFRTSVPRQMRLPARASSAVRQHDPGVQLLPPTSALAASAPWRLWHGGPQRGAAGPSLLMPPWLRHQAGRQSRVRVACRDMAGCEMGLGEAAENGQAVKMGRV